VYQDEIHEAGLSTDKRILGSVRVKCDSWEQLMAKKEKSQFFLELMNSDKTVLMAPLAAYT